MSEKQKNHAKNRKTAHSRDPEKGKRALDVVMVVLAAFAASLFILMSALSFYPMEIGKRALDIVMSVLAVFAS